MDIKGQKMIRASVGGANGIFAKLAAEKKKTITAVCLLSVMVLMWVKVFVGKSPETVLAEEVSGASVENQLELQQQLDGSKSKIFYVELPKVKGRNDVLARDFFSDDDTSLVTENVRGVEPVADKGRSEQVIRKISEKLVLDAIVLGQKPQAFINNRLYEAGDGLTVADETDSYDCEVVKIEETEVTIRCSEGTITLKISHPAEVLN